MTSGNSVVFARQQPRILICAPASGGGKTTFTCGLLHLMKRKGLSPLACKCGPDYIDPMFHTKVIGTPSRNLDLFFSSPDEVRYLVAGDELARACDVTVIEGVMGYYDGIAVSDEASAWDVSRVTDTPALLVVDGRGRARSIAAEVKGFAQFRNPSNIAGVVINRVSPMLYARLKHLIEDETGVPCVGYVPVLTDCSLESRHLGLVTADEVVDLQGKLDKLADALEASLDFEAIMELAQSAPGLCCDEPVLLGKVDGNPLIAVARDQAFCFYYEDGLRLLERLGARLAFFSPLRDAALPDGCSGLYLGGGYPELYAKGLSENAPMLAAIRNAVRAGMPTLAECGGFLYLHESLEGEDGAESYPMAGVVPGDGFKTGKLGRFGYVELTAKEDSLLCRKGETMRAHEFHYWDSSMPGDSFRAQKPQSTRGWDCVVATPSLYAGFPHMLLYSHPHQAKRFVQACADYQRATQDGIRDALDVEGALIGPARNKGCS